MRKIRASAPAERSGADAVGVGYPRHRGTSGTVPRRTLEAVCAGVLPTASSVLAHAGVSTRARCRRQLAGWVRVGVCERSRETERIQAKKRPEGGLSRRALRVCVTERATTHSLARRFRSGSALRAHPPKALILAGGLETSARRLRAAGEHAQGARSLHLARRPRSPCCPEEGPRVSHG